ncbi:uncharacterized protein LOC119687808 isoform X3 [Teleopsis dalmanni]|uniref:uncharacterized protein LOC119687808 isoform X3 n=1 Tax=Teleopsis dalmanni TaxID=139649 RepID=UPI0018CFA02D|nr:uncharacterized protein LOC119687808 isoform X3 [Teleopsis dalmanni]
MEDAESLRATDSYGCDAVPTCSLGELSKKCEGDGINEGILNDDKSETVAPCAVALSKKCEGDGINEGILNGDKSQTVAVKSQTVAPVHHKESTLVTQETSLSTSAVEQPKAIHQSCSLFDIEPFERKRTRPINPWQNITPRKPLNYQKRSESDNMMEDAESVRATDSYGCDAVPTCSLGELSKKCEGDGINEGILNGDKSETVAPCAVALSKKCEGDGINEGILNDDKSETVAPCAVALSKKCEGDGINEGILNDDKSETVAPCAVALSKKCEGDGINEGILNGDKSQTVAVKSQTVAPVHHKESTLVTQETSLSTSAVEQPKAIHQSCSLFDIEPFERKRTRPINPWQNITPRKPLNYQKRSESDNMMEDAESVRATDSYGCDAVPTCSLGELSKKCEGDGINEGILNDDKSETVAPCAVALSKKCEGDGINEGILNDDKSETVAPCAVALSKKCEGDGINEGILNGDKSHTVAVKSQTVAPVHHKQSTLVTQETSLSISAVEQPKAIHQTCSLFDIEPFEKKRTRPINPWQNITPRKPLNYQKRSESDNMMEDTESVRATDSYGCDAVPTCSLGELSKKCEGDGINEGILNDDKSETVAPCAVALSKKCEGDGINEGILNDDKSETVAPCAVALSKKCEGDGINEGILNDDKSETVAPCAVALSKKCEGDGINEGILNDDKSETVAPCAVALSKKCEGDGINEGILNGDKSQTVAVKSQTVAPVHHKQSTLVTQETSLSTSAVEQPKATHQSCSLFDIEPFEKKKTRPINPWQNITPRKPLNYQKRSESDNMMEGAESVRATDSYGCDAVPTCLLGVLSKKCEGDGSNEGILNGDKSQTVAVKSQTVAPVHHKQSTLVTQETSLSTSAVEQPKAIHQSCLLFDIEPFKRKRTRPINPSHNIIPKKPLYYQKRSESDNMMEDAENLRATDSYGCDAVSTCSLGVLSKKCEGDGINEGILNDDKSETVAPCAVALSKKCEGDGINEGILNDDKSETVAPCAVALSKKCEGDGINEGILNGDKSQTVAVKSQTVAPVHHKESTLVTQETSLSTSAVEQPKAIHQTCFFSSLFDIETFERKRTRPINPWNNVIPKKPLYYQKRSASDNIMEDAENLRATDSNGRNAVPTCSLGVLSKKCKGDGINEGILNGDKSQTVAVRSQTADPAHHKECTLVTPETSLSTSAVEQPEAIHQTCEQFERKRTRPIHPWHKGHTYIKRADVIYRKVDNAKDLFIPRTPL